GDHRPPGADVVDVAVAVDVEQVRPFRPLHEERLPAHRLERTHRRIDAAGQQRLRAGEQGPGTFGIHVLIFSIVCRSGCTKRLSAVVALVGAASAAIFLPGNTRRFGRDHRAFPARAADQRFQAASSKHSRYARAAATGSGASNTPLITATRSAPAATSRRALSGVMPPIATRGSPKRADSASSRGSARRAPGLVGEGKNAPNAR